VPLQVQVVGVKREHLRGPRARVVQQPPEGVLSQADGKPQQLFDLRGAERRGERFRLPVPEPRGRVRGDPALIKPPADGAAERG
jgi:hypothetical protein